METAAIIADMRKLRCGNCKVALHDELATICPVCSATFRGVSSNHAGLATKLRERRELGGVKSLFCEVVFPRK